ncbi:tRNA 2-thiouridine(34) synthase MnmA [Acinetobacter qingfengensis]|uniref:tRNA-specific 2-thiouridylase MnmA n=1 Tax=Acinetobacter qingfengensis TaxID=1262585 RepID=A0A1E7R9C8_9GAMM|nr:tRNA 2-thiouridine(34) synthase MnmA [Acinetobacter qingfengensis]KAA8735487.1 tRNA 2-thiouridine(34) synthase MnmA [Acinetobacter qingfengensis]OEY95867.1 tRNA 2-thiouridine(34) synthase MnmA [Acinetobacter qingfengensis]
MQKNVIVGMSGGVDSSVSAALLLEQGYHVEGLFMKNWEEDDGTEYCTAMQDLADAQAVADRLGIKLHTVNFSMEYWDRVFEHFLAEYSAGRTPNPDILCNKEIKFRAFLDYAVNLGADLIATGHYCRRGISSQNSQGETYAPLLRGLDNNKDQTYFLHAVHGREIDKTLFPVGELEKPQVREIAQKLGLSTATKKDSTGICFIGERRFNDFLKQYLPAQPGEIVLEDGTVIGQHHGLMYYTLGQRGGIGIGGMKNAAEGAWFVLHKDIANNRLVIGQGHEHSLMLSTQLDSEEIYWIAGEQDIPSSGLRCTAKTRYRQSDQACTIYRHDEFPSGVLVVFDEPQRAATPGQSVVFYQQQTCLGGGVIRSINAPLPQYLQR